jgi:hypothetical protein
MFGLQAPKLKQMLSGLPSGIGEALAGIIGDCESELQHSGPVELSGPVTFGDKAYSTQDRSGQSIGQNESNLLWDASTRTSYMSLADSVIRTLVTQIFSIYTLAADLNADATVTAGGKTYSGLFIRDTFKLASGTTVGAINGGAGIWYIIAADDCEVPQ